jgi:hypothetical protein
LRKSGGVSVTSVMLFIFCNIILIKIFVGQKKYCLLFFHIEVLNFNVVIFLPKTSVVKMVLAFLVGLRIGE